MNLEDIELMLLANHPIPLESARFVHIPTLRTITKIGLSTYNQYLSYLLIDKNVFNRQVDQSVTNFDVFFTNCFHDTDFKTLVFEALTLFFLECPSLVTTESDYYIRFGDKCRLDNSNFDQFQKIIKIANNIKLIDEPEYKPANSKAQKMIDMIMKNRKKQPKPKEKITLQSIISGLAWKENGLNILNIFDLNIFQIYNGFHSTNNIDNYYHTVTALYAGTIESKNIKMSEIHWANKFDT